MSANGTQAIDRAAELLSRVVLADEPPAFNDLVTDTGLAKSTASRLLQALERHRLVHRDDTGGYEAGSLFALYASKHDATRRADPPRPARARGDRRRHRRDRQPRDRARQHGRPDRPDRLDLPARHDQLGRRRGPRRTARRWARSSTPAARCRSRPTRDGAAYPTTPSPARPRSRAQLDDVRAQGYAETRGELEIGLDAIAAPVFGPADDGRRRASASPDRATGSATSFRSSPSC